MSPVRRYSMNSFATVNRRGVTASIVVMMTLLLGSGCKPEQDPEHMRERRQAEEEVRKRREAARKRFESQQQRDRVEEDRFKLWPAPVREAYATFFTARGQSMPVAGQTLAHLGLAAAPALRMIATKEGIDEKKRATASLLLVDLFVFQPKKLAEMAQESDHPYIQKGAIEALGRLGDPESEGLLKRLAQGADRGLERLLARARGTKHTWRYSGRQLVALDRILQADSPEKLEVAMEVVQDLKLERGLRQIIASPSTRPPVRAAVAYKFIELSRDRSEVLRRYCDGEQPKLLRLLSAKRLLGLGRKRDRRFIERLANHPGDPLAAAFRQLLDTGKNQ
jgi:hypothetical protein